jgi:hypothetical protein
MALKAADWVARTHDVTQQSFGQGTLPLRPRTAAPLWLVHGLLAAYKAAPQNARPYSDAEGLPETGTLANAGTDDENFATTCENSCDLQIANLVRIVARTMSDPKWNSPQHSFSSSLRHLRRNW